MMDSGKIHMEDINTLHGQNGEFLVLILVVHF